MFAPNSHYNDLCCREFTLMPDGLTYLLIFIAVVVVYTIAKVLAYMRQSDQQWDEVDKSKLKKWDDDED
ncbi:MAG: hypothetical protein E4H42_03880 [Chromatiales bacterium]|jgi:hypothetical protein|nr:MAG: hypothetical protein E4H42_03880 [Chromatiales bacterium]